MLEDHREAISELSGLIQDRPQWRGLFVDYEKPHVERLWRPWREYRLLLHKLLPCADGEALYHPHPWPSIMTIVRGRYIMGVGYGSGLVAPPLAMKLSLGPGSTYEMTDPDAWHYVQPLEATYTIMLVGKPTGRSAPKSSTPLRELNVHERNDLFNVYARILE